MEPHAVDEVLNFLAVEELRDEICFLACPLGPFGSSLHVCGNVAVPRTIAQNSDSPLDNAMTVSVLR